MLLIKKRIKLKLGFIIFSRLDSQRLPKKALLEINGKSLLERVLDRCKNANLDLPIIIATSTRLIDDQIENFSNNNKILIYRGELNDVALRAINCCKSFKLDGFIRICGDRIFMPYEVVRTAYKLYEDNNFDLVSNTLYPSYPKGCTVEIIKLSSLEFAYKQGLNTYQKEHLTSFYYNNLEKFCIKGIPDYIENVSDHNLSLDTYEDFDKFKNMIEGFDGNIEKLLLKDIISLSRQSDLEIIDAKS